MNVSDEQQVLWQIRGIVASMPEKQQARVNEALAHIRALLTEFGDEGQIALVLIGTEIAAKVTA